MNEQLLAIGNYCLDLVDGVYLIGGSVTFSAVTSSRLGVNPSILTRGQVATIDSFEEFSNVDVRMISNNKDSIFKVVLWANQIKLCI
jgi:hypothetical protein